MNNLTQKLFIRAVKSQSNLLYNILKLDTNRTLLMISVIGEIAQNSFT